jgi:hypothetical protein
MQNASDNAVDVRKILYFGVSTSDFRKDLVLPCLDKIKEETSCVSELQILSTLTLVKGGMAGWLTSLCRL